MTERSRALPAYQYGDPSDVVERNEESQLFEARLQNWRRVARAKMFTVATCWSAEGRYVAPRDETAALSEEDAEEAKERELDADPWPVDPDIARKLIADAWLFEDAWKWLPTQHRMLLAIVYHSRERMTLTRICYKMCIRRDQYGDLLREARARLRNRVRTMSSGG